MKLINPATNPVVPTPDHTNVTSQEIAGGRSDLKPNAVARCFLLRYLLRSLLRQNPLAAFSLPPDIPRTTDIPGTHIQLPRLAVRLCGLGHGHIVGR